MPNTADIELIPNELYEQHLRTVAARFERALEATGHDGVVIFAGEELPVARDDQVYPFRPEPYFVQCAPSAAVPGSMIDITPGRLPRLGYMQGGDYWHEPPASPAGAWVEHFEIEILDSVSAADRWLKRRGRSTAIGAPRASADRFTSIDDRRLMNLLDFDRAFKTPYEVACVQRANMRAARGHAAVAAGFAAQESEFALNQAYCAASAQRETELPYGNIIALNEHAAVLHYQNLRHERPEAHRSLLIDAGASYAGYTADVSRSYAQPGSPFVTLIDSMRRLQRTLCEAVRGDVDFVALNAEAHRLLAEVLAEHGLLRCMSNEALESGLTSLFLPHGLGHLLGLQVHDAGGRQISPEGELLAPPAQHPFLRLTRRLEPGFVLTIEPGIYFIPALLNGASRKQRSKLDLDAVARLIPYGGIRIEDDLLVESHGARNLTREAFALLEAAPAE